MFAIVKRLVGFIYALHSSETEWVLVTNSMGDHPGKFRSAVSTQVLYILYKDYITLRIARILVSSTVDETTRILRGTCSSNFYSVVLTYL